MSMAVGGKKSGPVADINVTPMADIMIVLLIIFMVITPMLAKGVDVKLPNANNTKEHQDKQKTAYEIRLSLVGSEMCIRDRSRASTWRWTTPARSSSTTSSRRAPPKAVSYTHLTLPTIYSV